MKFKITKYRHLLNKRPVEIEPEIYHKIRVFLSCILLPLFGLFGIFAFFFHHKIGLKPRGLFTGLAAGAAITLVATAMTQPKTKVFWYSICAIILSASVAFYFDHD